MHNPWKTRPETDLENIEAPEKPLPNVPLEEDRKEDTSETADLTRDKAEEKNEETIRQVESTEIQNHEKGIFDEIADVFDIRIGDEISSKMSPT